MKTASFISHLSTLGIILGVIAPVVAATHLFNANSTIRIAVWSLAIIILCVCIFKQWRQDSAVLASQPIVIIYGVLVAWLFARTFFSWNNFVWWGNWTRTDGIWMLAAWLIFLISTTLFFRQYPSRIKWILWLFVGVSILAAFFRGNTGIRLSGTVGNPLYLAQLLIFIPWAIGESVQTNTRRTWITAAAFCGAVALLIATRVRGVELALLVGVAVYISERWKKWGIAAVLVTACIGGFVAVHSGVVTRLAAEPTARIRLVLWHDAAQDIRKHWLFGIGYGNQDAIFQKSEMHVAQILYYEHPFDSSHNAYIDLLLEGGIVALVIFLVWCAVVYRSSGEGVDNKLGSLRKATFAVYLASALTSFFTVWGNIPLVLLLACVLKSRKDMRVYPGARSTVLGIVVASGFSAAILLFTVPIQARQLYVAEIATQKNAALDYFDAASHISSWFPFWRERDLHLISLSSHFLQQDVQEITKKRVAEIIVPRVDAIDSLRETFAEEDNTRAIFATSYALLLPLEQKNLWLMRAHELQQRALEKSPERPASVYQLAEILYYQGKGAEAVIYMGDYALRHPEFPKAHEMFELLKSIVGAR